MVETTVLTRRSLLTGSTVLLASLAGCGDADDSGGSDDGDDTDPTESGDGTEPQTDPDDLDLREANVVGVDVERDGGSVTFDVTLHHDVRKSGALAQPVRNRRFLRTTTGRRGTPTGGRSRHSTGPDWGAVT